MWILIMCEHDICVNINHGWIWFFGTMKDGWIWIMGEYELCVNFDYGGNIYVRFI